MNEYGQDFAEYALLLGFIAVLVIVIAVTVGDDVSAYFNALALAIGGR